ncbi:hypothetical protein MSPGM_19950 [Methylorubrum sp. GM97]|nr:hypothetical protein MSPGM_19950 [Methylorubrum sp. GM97]
MEAITTTGTFFDGLSARPRPVTLRLTFQLEVSGEDVSRDWSLLDLRAANAAPPLMRINHAQGSESIEFSDAAFAEALKARCPDLNRTESGGGLTRLVLWSIAAGVSVLLTAVYGVPAASNLLAPWSRRRSKRNSGAASMPRSSACSTTRRSATIREGGRCSIG